MRVIGLTIVVLLITASAAAAKPSDLPDFSNDKIVLGKSIGGVVLGAARSAAVDAWGGADSAADCRSQFSCIWTSNPNNVQNGPDGRGQIAFDDGLPEFTVSFVSIQAAEKAKKTAKKLRKLQTAKGIGLGDSVKALKKAYGKKLKKTGSGRYLGYELKTPNGYRNQFSFLGKKLHQISVGIR